MPFEGEKKREADRRRYGTAAYREWNAERMRQYRRGPYGTREYLAARRRELEAEKTRVAEQLAAIEKEITCVTSETE